LSFHHSITREKSSQLHRSPQPSLSDTHTHTHTHTHTYTHTYIHTHKGFLLTVKKENEVTHTDTAFFPQLTFQGPRTTGTGMLTPNPSEHNFTHSPNCSVFPFSDNDFPGISFLRLFHLPLPEQVTIFEIFKPEMV